MNVYGVVEKMPKENDKDKADVAVVVEPSEEVASSGDSGDLPFDLSNVDPKTLAKVDAMLEGTGFSIQKLANWANSMEFRVRAMQEEMPEVVQKAMEQAIMKARNAEMQRMEQMRQQGGGGGGGGGTATLLREIISSGSGAMDEDMLNLQKEMMRMSIEGMKTDIGFSKAIKVALVSKITGKEIGKIIE